MLKAGEAAKAKNLKVATGLMSRHYVPLEVVTSAGSEVTNLNQDLIPKNRRCARMVK